MTLTARVHDELDISTLAFWAKSQDQRDATFAELRRERPLSWHRPAQTYLAPDPNDPGYWAVVTHADILTVSRNPDIFGSGPAYGGVMLDNVPPGVLEAAHSILSMDDPRHSRLRAIISSVFTPRRVSTIVAQIEAQARAIVADLGTSGSVDFVASVASRLPMWSVSEMLGIPQPWRQEVADAALALVGWNDPELIGDGDATQVLFDGISTLHRISTVLSQQRAAEPQDDLMTALVQADVDGAQLTQAEIAAFFVLLCVAGNDTTRHATSQAMLMLDQHPDQKALLLVDFDNRINGAVEEILRCATPVMTFRRTARCATRLHGETIAPGEKLVMFYPSGNRDEAVFADPYRFDITRDPNPHLGFGGGGPHFCLGAHLARVQLRSILREVLHNLPDLVVGEPELLEGNFMNGIKRLPVSY